MQHALLSSNALARRDACVRDLVMMMRFPNNGRLSNQRISSLSFTTFPTTNTAGGSMPFSTTSLAAFSSVVVYVS